MKIYEVVVIVPSIDNYRLGMYTTRERAERLLQVLRDLAEEEGEIRPYSILEWEVDSET